MDEWTQKCGLSQASVVYTCNPNYLGSWNRDDPGSRPVPANSYQDPISKIIREKWTGGLRTGASGRVPLSSNSSPTRKKKNVIRSEIICLWKMWVAKVKTKKIHRDSLNFVFTVTFITGISIFSSSSSRNVDPFSTYGILTF
jgi:hypothetical protein